MPISVRLSDLEVQVGRFVYAFQECDEADGFQACVSMVNASYCERKNPYAAKTLAAHYAKRQTSKSEPFRRDDGNKRWYQVGT